MPQQSTSTRAAVTSTRPVVPPRPSSFDEPLLKLPIWDYLWQNRHRRRVRWMPNILSVLRIPGAVVTACYLYQALVHYEKSGAPGMFIAIGAVVVLFLTDAIDGTWAHQVGCVSSFGRVMDPIADKVLVMSILLSLGLAGFDLLPTSYARVVAVLMMALVVIEVVLAMIAIAEVLRHRDPQAEAWGKRKLTTEGVMSATLIGGLWLVAAGVTRPGQAAVAAALVALLAALHMGGQSIRGHWANLWG